MLLLLAEAEVRDLMVVIHIVEETQSTEEVVPAHITGMEQRELADLHFLAPAAAAAAVRVIMVFHKMPVQVELMVLTRQVVAEQQDRLELRGQTEEMELRVRVPENAETVVEAVEVEQLVVAEPVETAELLVEAVEVEEERIMAEQAEQQVPEREGKCSSTHGQDDK